MYLCESFFGRLYKTSTYLWLPADSELSKWEQSLRNLERKASLRWLLSAGPGGGKVAPGGTAFHGQRKGVPDPNAAETPVWLAL